MNFDDQLDRYSVLTNFFGIHSTSFQILNKLVSIENSILYKCAFLFQDILDNLQVCSLLFDACLSFNGAC